MKKVLLITLLFPLLVKAQERGCGCYEFCGLSYSINDSAGRNTVIDYTIDFGSPEYGDKIIDTLPIEARSGDSLTFYYKYFLSSTMFCASHSLFPQKVSTGIGIDSIYFFRGGGSAGSCWDSNNFLEYFAIQKGVNEIQINDKDGGYYLRYEIHWIKDAGNRNVNLKLSSSSSLNIATQKGNQLLKMFSMNGQLAYSTSFNTNEWADVNISLPENIFPSGIYILSLVSATEVQNFKVFVR